MGTCSFFWKGVVASWLVRSSPNQAVRIRALRGPFLEGSETFSYLESCSKISNVMITELFYSPILNMNRGSFHTRSFRRKHRYRLIKQGFVDLERYRSFRETGPWSGKLCCVPRQDSTLFSLVLICRRHTWDTAAGTVWDTVYGICEHSSPNHNLSQTLTAGLPAFEVELSSTPQASRRTSSADAMYDVATRFFQQFLIYR